MAIVPAEFHVRLTRDPQSIFGLKSWRKTGKGSRSQHLGQRALIEELTCEESIHKAIYVACRRGQDSMRDPSRVLPFSEVFHTVLGRGLAVPRDQALKLRRFGDEQGSIQSQRGEDFSCQCVRQGIAGGSLNNSA